MRKFLFSYWFRGEQYVLEVEAESEGVARQRHMAMSKAEYDGELKAKIKVVPNWLARLFK